MISPDEPGQMDYDMRQTHLGGVEGTGRKNDLLLRSESLDLATNKGLYARGLDSAATRLREQDLVGLSPSDDLDVWALASRHAMR